LGRPVSYGSIGVGTSLHLFGVILEKEYGVPLNHVPYKGEVQATADVMNGALDVAWASLLIAKPLAAAGKIQALAITGPKRFAAWPELATFAEQGFPGFEMPVWGGAYLPAGTPKPIVERLSREIVEVLRMPEVSDKLSAEKNRTLTRVGAGTPMGELLRRYWHPVAAVSELDGNPIKPVRIMGEDLVVYRDLSGTYGLIARHCKHRGADLAYGYVEQCG